MITAPKEKAKELVLKYGTYVAIICAKEILASSPSLPILSESGSFASDIKESTRFWKEVIKELEKS